MAGTGIALAPAKPSTANLGKLTYPKLWIRSRRMGHPEPTPPAATQPVLDTEAVAAILGVRRQLVTQWLSDSRPGRRYADHPFPTPDGRLGGRAPWWKPERRDEFTAWMTGRPGRGAGGGRPRLAE